MAAHSTTRALYTSYNGPLYQIKRLPDGRMRNIAVVNGFAEAAAQDWFCANTTCFITKVNDQSPMHNDLTQAPNPWDTTTFWADDTSWLTAPPWAPVPTGNSS